MLILLRYLPAILAALALSGGVWWVMALRADNAALTAQNAALSRSLLALEAQAAHAAEARRVEAARAEAWRARTAELSETIEQLRGIPDAPLDPAIIDLLDGLRGGPR